MNKFKKPFSVFKICCSWKKFIQKFCIGKDTDPDNFKSRIREKNVGIFSAVNTVKCIRYSVCAVLERYILQNEIYKKNYIILNMILRIFPWSRLTRQIAPSGE
jgi:hypothetical protein